MSNPFAPSSGPREEQQCPPGTTQAYGQPTAGQPVQMGPPSGATTVNHVQYPPAPVAGVPIHGQGYQGHPQMGGYQQNRFPPGQGGQQFRMPDGTTLVMSEEAGSMQHVVARSYARAVRLFAIVDSLICVLYVVSGFYYAGTCKPRLGGSHPWQPACFRLPRTGASPAIIDSLFYL